MAIGKRLSVDLAAYYNDYDRQISVEPAAPFFEATPLPQHMVQASTSANLIDGETHGAELAATWKVTDRWTLAPSYDFERIHMHPRSPSQDTKTGPETDGNDPHQHARLRSHVDLPHKIGWDTSVYFTDQLASGAVPSYTRLDTGGTWQWSERLAISFFGENLLKARHPEFLDDAGATRVTLIRRGWYARMAWRF